MKGLVSGNSEGVVLECFGVSLKAIIFQDPQGACVYEF